MSLPPSFAFGKIHLPRQREAIYSPGNSRDTAENGSLKEGAVSGKAAD